MTKVTTHQAHDDARNEDILISLNGKTAPRVQDPSPNGQSNLIHTFGEQTPVSRIDRRPIGRRDKGPITAHIRDLHKALILETCG